MRVSCAHLFHCVLRLFVQGQLFSIAQRKHILLGIAQLSMGLRGARLPEDATPGLQTDQQPCSGMASNALRLWRLAQKLRVLAAVQGWIRCRVKWWMIAMHCWLDRD
jgi:hypothetical protein